MVTISKNAAMAGGALFGAYTSDITDDPLSGILTAGVGAAMGGFMRLPQSSFKDMSKVSVGPSIDIDFINSKKLALDNKDEFNSLMDSVDRNLSRYERNVSRVDLVNKRHRTVLDRIEKKERNFEKFRTRLESKAKKKFNAEGGDKNPGANYRYSLELERIGDLFDEHRGKQSLARANANSRYTTLQGLAIIKDESINDLFKKVRETLVASGVSVDNTRTSIREAIKGVTDTTLLTKLNSTLKNNTTSYIDINKLDLKELISYKSNIAAGDTKTLTSWFTKQLGNSPQEAEEKAKMFINRAGASDIIVKDGSISFEDSANGKRVTVPLTSYGEDGTRFHYEGGGNYKTVSQYNPYAAAYVSDKDAMFDGALRRVTAADVIKGYDPEMLIKNLDKDTPIQSILGSIKSLFHYDSQDTGISEIHLGPDFQPTSQKFKNSQNFVELGLSYNINDKGLIDSKYPMRNLKTGATEGLASEHIRLIRDKLSFDLDPNQSAGLFDSVSMNKSTTINTSGFKSLAAFAPSERNETGVGSRDTNIVQKNQFTRMIEDLMGTDNFNKQFSSSQALGKLDIKNTDLFNELISTMYGNDYVLGDGAGFFNMDNKGLKISENAVLKIPVSSTGEVGIVNTQLARALQSPTGMTDYLANNPISIGNEVIAYRPDGSEIKLNSMYTSGTITDGFLSNNQLRIQVNGIFDAAEEENLKFYSTGTKSLNTGLSGNHFNIATEVGMMVNSGELVGGNGLYKLNGVSISARDLKIEAAKRRGAAVKNKTAKTFTLIGDASETGVQSIVDRMESGMRGNAIYDDLSNRGFLKSEAALTAMMLGESKASVDLSATVAIGLQQAIRREFDPLANELKNGSTIDYSDARVQRLVKDGYVPAGSGMMDLATLQGHSQAFKQRFLDTFDAFNYIRSTDKQKIHSTALDLIRKSGVAEDYMKGQGYAIGSMNKGMSVVGAGNRAGMSWNARSNLKLSGMTNDQLKLFGNKSDELLYEVRSMLSERGRSKSSINTIIAGKEQKFLDILSSKATPEHRLEFLMNSYGSGSELKNNPFLTYNLTTDDHEIKSINFSRISTKRSGFYEGDDGIKLLKDLDKSKLGILKADIDYRTAKTKDERVKAKTYLTGLLDEYTELHKSIAGGSNSLAKAALSLESKHSDIMQVKTIGGNADKFATSMMTEANGYKNVWFISEEEAEHKAKQIGATIHYEDVDTFNNIKKPVFKRGNEVIPLASLLTREPAQGPLSSDLVSWYVDKTIKQGNIGNAFVGSSNTIYSKGMFGDADQDTIQTLLGNFRSKSQYDEIEADRRGIRATFLGMSEILDQMKVKGVQKKDKSLADFKSVEEYVFYKNSSAAKGRNRKLLAAPATGLAVAYSKALELEFGTNGVKDARLVEGRILSHQIVENLIKSAHVDTDAFSKQQEQSVERLTRLRGGFVGSSGYDRVTAKQYEEGLRTELPKFLNLSGMAEGVAKQRATGIMENIIKSEMNQSAKIGQIAYTPLDLPQHRFSKESYAHIDALNSIISEAGITEIDLESGLTNVRKSSKQVAMGTKDLLMDTLKNNKMVIGGGLAAMAGIALMGRSEPNFSDSRSQSRQYAASMVREASTYDNSDSGPMGQATSSTKTGYVTPKSFTSKNTKIEGEFVQDGEQTYTQYSSMLDADNINDQIYNISNSIFGSGVRTARLQNN